MEGKIYSPSGKFAERAKIFTSHHNVITSIHCLRVMNYNIIIV